MGQEPLRALPYEARLAGEGESLRVSAKRNLRLALHFSF